MMSNSRNRFRTIASKILIGRTSSRITLSFIQRLPGVWPCHSHSKIAKYPDINKKTKTIIALLIVLVFLLMSGYFAIFEWLWHGQTPGKRWMKLRVIREDVRPISIFEAIVRNLLREFDIMPFPFYSIGLISVFSTGRDQRVGDLVAGTVVVREREAEAPAFAEVFASPVSDPALRRSFKPVDFVAELDALTESEIQVVETFLRRRWDLVDMARQWMAWRVSLPLLYKLRPRYDLATFTYEGFLEELLHRYRARHRFTE